MPETIDIMRFVELEPDAKRFNRDLVKESVTALGAGEVSVTNVLSKLLRLSQLTGGFLTNDEGGRLQQVSTAKLDMLSDILDAALEEGRELVIIARFLPEIVAIRKMLVSRNIGFACIQGGTSNRDEEVARFQNNHACAVFVGQIATAGLGITLTAASTMVFYSLDYSMSNFEQAKARIHRTGQCENCTYYYLIARGTVDAKVLKAEVYPNQ